MSVPSVQSLQRNDAGLQPVFVISVDDPQKVGDPIRGYTMYTVHTRVSLITVALSTKSLNKAP